jgi:hypothetical protein
MSTPFFTKACLPCGADHGTEATKNAHSVLQLDRRMQEVVKVKSLFRQDDFLIHRVVLQTRVSARPDSAPQLVAGTGMRTILVDAPSMPKSSSLRGIGDSV